VVKINWTVIFHGYEIASRDICRVKEIGNNLTHARDMFSALTEEAFNITNTHVLWGDTSHDPVTTKFPLKLGIHSVHEYVGSKMPTDEWEVIFQDLTNRHTFKTGTDMVPTIG
jgi:hypothetical protein